MRRLVAATLLAAAVVGVAAPAATAGPRWICPWSVSKAVGDATGHYICYA